MKLEPGEWIWSWGEYRYAKFRSIRDVCKACWPEVRDRLNDHTGGCGCVVTIVCRGADTPAWMTLEDSSGCATKPGVGAG